MWYSSTGSIYFNVQMASPTCRECGGVPHLRTNDGVHLCRRCIDAHNRRVAIAQAEGWLMAAFAACKPDQRAKLYRSLSTLFHPDVGGDEQLMQALNLVKERFP